MKFKIEKHILKKAEELSFITIKHDSEFKVEGRSEEHTSELQSPQ